MLVCPGCSGDRQVFAHVNTQDPETHGFQWIDCSTCKGAGEITEDMRESIDAGRKARQNRIDRGLTLRQEADRLGVSAVVLSRLERGYR